MDYRGGRVKGPQLYTPYLLRKSAIVSNHLNYKVVAAEIAMLKKRSVLFRQVFPLRYDTLQSWFRSVRKKRSYYMKKKLFKSYDCPLCCRRFEIQTPRQYDAASRSKFSLTAIAVADHKQFACSTTPGLTCRKRFRV